MKELDYCLELARGIKAKEERIIEIKARAMAPKNQLLSDMPKGGGKDSAMDDYLVKLDRLTRNLDRQKKKLDAEWKKAKYKLNGRTGVNDKSLKLVKFRFYYALSWKKCAAYMQEMYPDERWNVNKCFRVYRKIEQNIY